MPDFPSPDVDIVDELLNDATLVQTYGQRTGLFDDDKLARAIMQTRKARASNADFDLVALSSALNDAMRRIRPLTLVDLRRWNPFAPPPPGRSHKSAPWKYLFILCAIVLLFVCGHYTSWHKRATKLLDETLTVANETQGDLVSDMVYFFADGGADLAQPAAAAKVPFREMVDELRLQQIRMDQNLQRNLELDADFVPLRVVMRGVVHRYLEWKGILGTAAQPAPPVVAAGASFLGTEVPKPVLLALALTTGPEGGTVHTRDNISLADCGQIKTPLPFFAEQETESAPTFAGIGNGILQYDTARRSILCFAGVNPDGAKYFVEANWTYKLSNRIDLLSAWILPALYGALGAVMFYLRDFLNPLRPDPGFVEVAVRVALGLFAGVSVGWFAAPTTMVQGIGISDLSLATLTLAFLVGFGIDVFFALLDRLLELFRGSVSRIGSSEEEKARSGRTANAAGSPG